MKIKLIDSWYDEESGNSYAKIRTDYGEFEGWSTLHEEDADLASKYAGCQYAETRAVLKYMKKIFISLGVRTIISLILVLTI